MATNLKQRAAKVVVGSGVPANGDELSLSWIKFKIGTFYIDDANNKIYSRTARNKVAADWDLLSGGGSGGGVESVTYKATLKQTTPTSETSGSLIVGVAYMIETFEAGDDFSNVANVKAGVINENNCVFIATGTTPTNWSNGSLVTAANIEAVEFSNTMEAAPWQYDGVGEYIARTNIDYVEGRTYIAGFPVDMSTGNTRFVPVYGNQSTVAFRYFVKVDDWGDGKLFIDLRFVTEDFQNADLVDLIGGQRFILPEIQFYAP